VRTHMQPYVVHNKRNQPLNILRVSFLRPSALFTAHHCARIKLRAAPLFLKIPYFKKFRSYFTDPAAERMGRSRSRSRSRERRRDEDRKRSRPSDDFASARDFDRQDSRRVFTSLSLSVAAQNRASTQCLGESVERLRVRVFNTRPCLWLRAGTFQASALGRLDASGWCLCRTSS
jgi:hypothetical protein